VEQAMLSQIIAGCLTGAMAGAIVIAVSAIIVRTAYLIQGVPISGPLF